MAGVAQDEVRKLSERLKFGFRQAIKNGHVLGNDRLWGYDKSGCVLTVNETEAQAVRRIFDLYANQQLGIRRISQILFDEGFTSRQGNAFNVLTIRHILCNPKYKGWYCGSKSQTVDYRSKRKVFLDESEWVMYPDPSVPAIVSEELWDRANALYKARSKQMQAHACGADFFTTAIHTAVKSSARNTARAITGSSIKRRPAARRSGNAGFTATAAAQAAPSYRSEKGSTRERVELEIFLKFGDPQRVIFSHRKTSDCFNPCSVMWYCRRPEIAVCVRS